MTAGHRKLLSIVTPCYNEEGNVRALREATLKALEKLPEYDHEHLFIDNASKDGTASALRELAAADPRVKVILNARNFGHIRSPHHAILQTRGDAVIPLVADLQDPPDLIVDFVRKWEAGYKVVLGVKTSSEESWPMWLLRNAYYSLIGRLSEIQLTKNNTGFGLYDRQVIEVVRRMDDPYPYFRGMISDIGFESAKIDYRQKSRKRGITANNFYTLYDMAMLGITNHSKIPLRLATMLGFALSAVSAVISVAYLLLKLLFWYKFDFGLAPVLIGIFFFTSVQLFFIGILGEYIGAIHTQVLRRPLVVERERIGFD